MDGGDSVSNGDVSYRFTHDVKAGLSLRWAHIGFIDAFMFNFYEPRLEKTAQLVSYIVQFPSFRNLIFHASRRLLRGYNTIFDGPGRKPQSRQVFSRRGDGFEKYTVHVSMFFLIILIELFYKSFFGEHDFKVCSPFKMTQCTSVCSFLFNYCKLNIKF